MNLRRRPAFLLLFVLAFAVSAAHAQFGLYAMGSGGFLGSTSASQGSLLVQNSGFSSYGGTIGLYDDFAHLGPVRLGSDVRYFQETSSNSNSYGNKLHGLTTGLRLEVRAPLIPFKPYVQAEVGGVGTNYGTQAGDTGVFAYQIQGGVDFTLIPHLDLRGEYGGGQIDGVFAGSKQALQQAGIGLVVRFF